MHAPFATLAALCLLSGCSLSVGAGAQANLGRRAPGSAGECDNFESCDAAYRAAARRAAHCHQSDVDCEDEERDVMLSYRALREQTQRELDELRRQAWQAEQDAQTARADEQTQCSTRIRALEERHRANPSAGWFEEPPPSPAAPTHP